MPLSREYLDYVLGQLAAVDGTRARRMFGGAGLYCGELFFGIVSGDTLYLRTDEATRQDYTARGMAPFRPYADRPEVSMSYFAVPAEVLEEPDELAAWARRAIAVAQAAHAIRPRGTPRRPSARRRKP